MSPDLHDRFTILQTVLMFVVFVVVIAIAVVSLGTANKARHAATQAEQAASQASINRATNYQTCLSSNEFRSENKGLWLAIVALIPKTTARGAKFDAAVLAAVNKTFAPRPCALAATPATP